MNDFMKTNLLEEIAKMNDSQVDPIYQIRFGDRKASQSIFNAWVMSANPAYSEMKPWYLSWFSAGFLSSNSKKYEGYLLPGFCPYRPVYRKQEMF